MFCFCRFRDGVIGRNKHLCYLIPARAQLSAGAESWGNSKQWKCFSCLLRWLAYPLAQKCGDWMMFSSGQRVYYGDPGKRENKFMVGNVFG